jgi:diguanylate cyclase (GGDEF)-like protein/PAS domain S-box-containing protein
MIILNTNNNNTPLHKSLLRVLKKHSLGIEKLPATQEEWQEFLKRVDQLLSSNDEDRYLLERSLEITSREMQELIDASQKKYQNKINSLLQVIPDMIFYLDENGKYLELIADGSDDYFYKPVDKAQGEHISKIFPKDYAKAIQKKNKEAIRENRLKTIECQMADESDFKRFYEVRIMPTPLLEGGIKTSVVIVRDITDRKQSMFYYQMMSKVIEDAQEGIFIASLTGEYIGHNRAFLNIFGFDESTKPELTFDKCAKFFDDATYRKIKEAIDGTGRFKGEATVIREDGSRVLTLLSINTISPQRGMKGYRVAIVSDISELHKSREELYYTATHDALTGLPNRKFILESISKSIKRLRREGKKGALIFIDLDNFKAINDLLGHKAGDELLCQVTERVKSRIRSSDLFGRLGGDEFLLFIENIESVDSVANLAQTIINILTTPFNLEGSEHKIGASLGIAIFPDDSDDADELLQYADKAMYNAKENGKNGYFFYSRAMEKSVQEFKRVEKIIEKALKYGGFCLYYQPQFEMKSCEIVGIEALVRLDERLGKGIGPREFIPVAKESGLIVPLSKWILEEACKQISKWQNVYGIKDIYISLNVADRQIMDEKWADEVAELIYRYQIDPNLLEFEITEDILMQSRQTNFRTLRKLRAIGCRLALDDFGTGIMSLSTLEPNMIHRIKIDQSFISKLDRDPMAKRIIKASISLAHSMELITVAEGVEKQSQRDELISLKCDQAQGFLLANPLKSSDILKFMVKHSSIDSDIPTLKEI